MQEYSNNIVLLTPHFRKRAMARNYTHLEDCSTMPSSMSIQAEQILISDYRMAQASPANVFACVQARAQQTCTTSRTSNLPRLPAVCCGSGPSFILMISILDTKLCRSCLYSFHRNVLHSSIGSRLSCSFCGRSFNWPWARFASVTCC